MRSLQEVLFRLRQEAANLWLAAAPPQLQLHSPAPLLGLPAPRPIAQGLLGTPYAQQLLQLADSISEHRLPIFGTTLDTGPAIRWTYDYFHHIETPPIYFRRLPYLDFNRCGDHKNIWELNRHQHLVLLAQAWTLSGNLRYLDVIASHLTSWWKANPIHRSINWASALEVAFRVLSWIWVFHLAGEALPSPVRTKLLSEIYLHGLHLEYNLSIFFSPNTHLLGEAVALHALGVLFPSWPRSGKWQRLGGDTVLQAMHQQVQSDGSHFEQSTYYHVYALDFFLLRHILEPAPPDYVAQLRRMADFLHALMGPPRRIPFFGDDDGGRLFHPYGARDEFGRATLATCQIQFPGNNWGATAEDLPFQAAWWLGTSALVLPPAPQPKPHSRLFQPSGLAVLQTAEAHIVADAGPMGFGGSGHSHADALSCVVRLGAEDILIDPGTLTYVGDPVRRNWFRGTSAHNTVRVDAADQAVPLGPFRWTAQPQVEVLSFTTGADADRLDAIFKGKWTHRRRLVLRKPERLLLVLDEIQGEPGDHLIEQFWHGVSPESLRRISLAGGEFLLEPDSRSRVFGATEPSCMLRQFVQKPLPVCLAAALDLSECPQPSRFTLHNESSCWYLCWEGSHLVREAFPASL